jgi:hypothetical protein
VINFCLAIGGRAAGGIRLRLGSNIQSLHSGVRLLAWTRILESRNYE